MAILRQFLFDRAFDLSLEPGLMKWAFLALGLACAVAVFKSCRDDEGWLRIAFHRYGGTDSEDHRVALLCWFPVVLCLSGFGVGDWVEGFSATPIGHFRTAKNIKSAEVDVRRYEGEMFSIGDVTFRIGRYLDDPELPSVSIQLLGSHPEIRSTAGIMNLIDLPLKRQCWRYLDFGEREVFLVVTEDRATQTRIGGLVTRNNPGPTGGVLIRAGCDSLPRGFPNDQQVRSKGEFPSQ